MPINTTSKEKPAGDGDPRASGALNALSYPSTVRTGRAISKLSAEIARKSHALRRAVTNDGAVNFCVERWGLVRHLPTVDAVRRFLDQIGSRL